MGRNGAIALYTLLIACGVCAAEEPAPSLNPEQFQRFVTRMVDRLPPAEREHIGLPSACPTYDDSSICPWLGFYSHGFDICRALRTGWSRACVGKLMLAESGQSFRDAWIDTSAEIICPDVLTRSREAAQPEPAPAATGSDEERGFRPDTTKDHAFIDSMIGRLPEDTRDCYRELCRTYDREQCPLWGMSSLGDAVCEAFASGQSRDEVLEGSQGFYKESELQAIVDTAVEVICPEYRGR